MGDIKPLGSEKLQGSDKMKRILELTYYHENKNNPKSTTKSELVKESANGVYGIIREKDGYHVKKGLTESTLDYIGGMFMKNKNKFNSYAEALKRLELLSSQEIQEEATKYVLKQNKSKMEAPAPAPTFPEPAASAPAPSAPSPSPASSMAPEDMGNEDPVGGEAESPSLEDEPMDSQDMGGDEGADHMKEVQRLSGKLGQAIREIEDKMESDDVKYVINMILSAVDIEKLSDEDKEAIIDRFEPEENYDDAYTPEEPETGEDIGGEPSPEDEPEDELAETMRKLEELINTKIGSQKTPKKPIEAEIDEYFFDASDLKMDDMEPAPREPRVSGSNKIANSKMHGDNWFDEDDSYADNVDDFGDEEEYSDYDAYSSKYAGEDDPWFRQGVRKGFSSDVNFDDYSKNKEMFDRYAPIKVRKRKPSLDISPELTEINEAINTTLSKYFE